MAVPCIATILGTLAKVLEVKPWLLSQKMNFAFMREGQQWTFQVFPQGYLHSSTVSHEMLAKDLSLFSFPTSLKWVHYIDDTMFSCKDLPLLQDTL